VLFSIMHELRLLSRIIV